MPIIVLLVAMVLHACVLCVLCFYSKLHDMMAVLCVTVLRLSASLRYGSTLTSVASILQLQGGSSSFKSCRAFPKIQLKSKLSVCLFVHPHLLRVTNYVIRPSKVNC